MRVCLVVVPEVTVSTLIGLYDVLNCFETMSTIDDAVPPTPPFDVELVAAARSHAKTLSGLPVIVHRTLDEVEQADIVIVPSVMVERSEWVCGRHPALVQWLRAMHETGAQLCSACSGVLLLAETGLLDGHDATIHWAYAPTFRRNFPRVVLRLEKVLVATGERERFVMAGASASWHDLALYLVARHVGPTAAQALARFMLLQWHADGQAPYITFRPRTDHGDAIVSDAQEWLRAHYADSGPVEAMVRRSRIPERSFKRRFRTATEYTPISYVQHLRVGEAKRRLERTNLAIDRIGWAVGYEDPASFRRLFKRLTGVTPGVYRRKFRIPGELP
jgi:transcriptional regulator GlxA family with amidase domain